MKYREEFLEKLTNQNVPWEIREKDIIVGKGGNII
jgi:hypothetical protein